MERRPNPMQWISAEVRRRGFNADAAMSFRRLDCEALAAIVFGRGGDREQLMRLEGTNLLVHWANDQLQFRVCRSPLSVLRAIENCDREAAGPGLYETTLFDGVGPDRRRKRKRAQRGAAMLGDGKRITL